MRDSAPVFRDPQSGMWHVFKYGDVERVLTQFATFSSRSVDDGEGYDASGNMGTPASGEAGQGRATILESMLMTDPPLHTKLRNIVSKSFAPSAIALLEPRIRKIARDLLMEGSQAEFDFVSDFAEPLPVTVIAEMLGVPADDRRRFKQWSDNEIGSPSYQAQGEVDLQSRRKSHAELAGYFSSILEKRKKNPENDLVSSIVNSEVDGERLSSDQAISFCILLLVAGNETTTNLLANALRLFARYGTLKDLSANPRLIPSAVEEVLRYSSPVRAMFRRSVKEAEIGGRKIGRGESIMAWIGSANRDESMFAEADSFKIDRNPNPHIAFGRGIHACLGASLARLEACVALEVLSQKYSGVSLGIGEEDLVPIANIPVGGVRSLPVTFRQRGS